MDYEEVLNTIQAEVNKRKIDFSILRSAIISFKVNFGKTISTEFLKNLIEGTDRKKENKIYNIVKGLGFEMDFKNKYFSEWVCENYKTEVVEYYKGKDGNIYIKNSKIVEISKPFIATKVKTFRQFLI